MSSHTHTSANESLRARLPTQPRAAGPTTYDSTTNTNANANASGPAQEARGREQQRVRRLWAAPVQVNLARTAASLVQKACARSRLGADRAAGWCTAAEGTPSYKLHYLYSTRAARRQAGLAPALVHGVWAPMADCTTGGGTTTDAASRALGRRPGQDAYIVRYCTRTPGPDGQAIHALANYPRNNEVQCDTAGNIQIGPPSGIDYSFGQPPGALNIDPVKGGIQFKVITQSAGNFDSASSGANTVASIRNRAVQAAKAWYVEALEALSFKPFLLPDGTYQAGGNVRASPYDQQIRSVQYRRLASARFRFREFAWWPIGKIAYVRRLWFTRFQPFRPHFPFMR